MDLENIARKGIEEGKEKQKIINEIALEVGKFKKKWSREKIKAFSEAVYEEVESSLKYRELKDIFLKKLLSYEKSKLKAGEAGVGSRGLGDFAVHEAIRSIIENRGLIERDDAGMIELGDNFLLAAIDGMHSRLSEFPFLAAFHATRAAVRDIAVKGALPHALIVDLRIGDDGDVAKLLDFTSGVACVSELVNAPIIAGSTLRIGGDMVFGERLVATVAAIGKAERVFPRRNAKEGDIIFATQGKGGGTITTIAIFNNAFEIIKETLNIDFFKACRAIIKSRIAKNISSMSDVTNGGLRGDAYEIAKTSKKNLIFYADRLPQIISPKIKKVLDGLEIDYLGISTDSLLLILPESAADTAKKIISGTGTEISEIGYVERAERATEAKAFVIDDGRKIELKPKFREAAYTKIKKIVGESKPENFDEIIEKIEKIKKEAIKKKREVKEFIESS